MSKPKGLDVDLGTVSFRPFCIFCSSILWIDGVRILVVLGERDFKEDFIDYWSVWLFV